jgi:hypothetical protein
MFGVINPNTYNRPGEANTSRSPSYAILAIDSEDRFRNYDENAEAGSATRNGSPYNFTITKAESIMNGFFTRLAVTEVCFPWMIGNIIPSTTQIIGEFQNGAGPLTQFDIDISDNIGFLRPSQIAALIQTRVRAADASLSAFTMTYGTIPGATASFPNFAYATNNPSVTVSFFPLAYNTIEFPYNNTEVQLFNLLGFDYNNTLPATSAVSRVTYCQSVRYIDIVSSQLSYNQALKDTMTQTVVRDSLCRLYLGDGPYTGTSTLSPSDSAFCPPGCAPFVIYRQFTNPKFIRWQPNQPVQGTLTFQVYDDNGELLTYLDAEEGLGANWSMTLLVSED